jgi:hypothetical protein
MYTFYAGISEANKIELDSTFDGAFMNYEMQDAWALLSSAHHAKEIDNYKKSGKYYVVDLEYITRFLNSRKMEDLLGHFNLNPEMIVQMVKAYTRYLQVPLG